MEYRASVSSSMYIDKNGTRLDSMNVGVDDYCNHDVISETMADYNANRDIVGRWERAHENLGPFGNPEIRFDDWRTEIWWMMYSDMVANLLKWRKRHT